MNLKTLRKKYKRFVYKDFSYRIYKNDLEISFDFSIEPDIHFKPKVLLKNIDKKRFKKIKKKVIDNLVFNLGMIEVLSYWKATCSPEIEIKKGSLSREQIKWWKDLIIDGMGQFFYENKINWRNSSFLKIKAQEPRKVNIFKGRLKNEFLVPIGGGKDSALTLELLKRMGKKITCFSLNPTDSSKTVMKTADCKNPVIVERKIDKKLLELNREGFLNGHTPFSAYIAFLSVFVSVLFNKKYISLSNERSSDEGNLLYLGKEVNHQYSKSYHFERKFKSYSKKYLTEDVEYFSFLRPLYDIQIASLFSRYPKYLKSFLSCNEAYKTYSGTRKRTKKWCLNCPKCLFVFSCLYPFIKKEMIIKIFGENLFEKEELLPLMKELTGVEKFKPFECVGTKRESQLAFYLSWKKANRIAEKPVLLEYFKDKILPRTIGRKFVRGLSQYPYFEKETKIIMNSWNKKNNLSKKLEKQLKNLTTLNKD